MGQTTILTLLTVMLFFAMPISLLADDPLWIDVRTTQEFSDGHVTEAVNIAYEDIGDHIDAITTDKDALIYLYCRSGRRSGIAKETLDNLGYTRVINIGGLEDALTKAGQEPGG